MTVYLQPSSTETVVHVSSICRMSRAMLCARSYYPTDFRDGCVYEARGLVVLHISSAREGGLYHLIFHLYAFTVFTISCSSRDYCFSNTTSIPAVSKTDRFVSNLITLKHLALYIHLFKDIYIPASPHLLLFSPCLIATQIHPQNPLLTTQSPPKQAIRALKPPPQPPP